MAPSRSAVASSLQSESSAASWRSGNAFADGTPYSSVRMPSAAYSWTCAARPANVVSRTGGAPSPERPRRGAPARDSGRACLPPAYRGSQRMRANRARRRAAAAGATCATCAMRPCRCARKSGCPAPAASTGRPRRRTAGPTCTGARRAGRGPVPRRLRAGAGAGPRRARPRALRRPGAHGAAVPRGTAATRPRPLRARTARAAATPRRRWLRRGGFRTCARRAGSARVPAQRVRRGGVAMQSPGRRAAEWTVRGCPGVAPERRSRTGRPLRPGTRAGRRLPESLPAAASVCRVAGAHGGRVAAHRDRPRGTAPGRAAAPAPCAILAGCPRRHP